MMPLSAQTIGLKAPRMGQYVAALVALSNGGKLITFSFIRSLRSSCIIVYLYCNSRLLATSLAVSWFLACTPAACLIAGACVSSARVCVRFARYSPYVKTWPRGVVKVSVVLLICACVNFYSFLSFAKHAGIWSSTRVNFLGWVLSFAPHDRDQSIILVWAISIFLFCSVSSMCSSPYDMSGG